MTNQQVSSSDFAEQYAAHLRTVLGPVADLVRRLSPIPTPAELEQLREAHDAAYEHLNALEALYEDAAGELEGIEDCLVEWEAEDDEDDDIDEEEI